MYTDRQHVEKYLLIDIDESFHDQIDEWIEAISNYMDRICNRKLVAEDDEPTEKVYDGTDTDILLVDDFIELDSVSIGEDELDADNYFAYPSNSTPKNRIEYSGGRFTIGRQNVTVSAVWGYFTELPEDIRYIATVLVAGIVNTQIGTEGEVQSETIGRYSVTYRSKKEIADYENALQMLKAYKRY